MEDLAIEANGDNDDRDQERNLAMRVCPYVNVRVGEESVVALLDSGSQCNVCVRAIL